MIFPASAFIAVKKRTDLLIICTLDVVRLRRHFFRRLEVLEHGIAAECKRSLKRIEDLLDDPGKVMAALKHFRHNHHDVLVMQVLDPLERSFAFGGDAVFKDLETAEEMTTQPYHIQRAYQKEMRAFLDRYKRECRENNIDYVLLDTETPFDTALFQYLNKRKKIG